MLELLVAVLWDSLLQIVLDLFLELGTRLFGEGFRARSRAHPIVAALALFLVGGLIGAGFTWLVPYRLVRLEGGRGLSLVLSPLVTGALMSAYGQWREARGGQPSYAATFWGGALFALGVASARFLLLQRWS